jgi:hypothetical protein
MCVVVACTSSKSPQIAKNFTDSQVTHSVLWKPKIHYHVQKDMPTIWNIREKWIHSTHFPFRSILIFCPCLCIGIQNHLSLTGFLEENFLWLSSFECSIYPTQLILTIFCENWKLWSSPFWNFCRILLLSSLSIN